MYKKLLNSEEEYIDFLFDTEEENSVITFKDEEITLSKATHIPRFFGICFEEEPIYFLDDDDEETEDIDYYIYYKEYDLNPNALFPKEFPCILVLNSYDIEEIDHADVDIDFIYLSEFNIEEKEDEYN